MHTSPTANRPYLHVSLSSKSSGSMFQQGGRLSSPYYFNRVMQNRHRDCPGEVYDKRNLETASSDNQLLKPSTVRGNNRLKAKPAVSRMEKQRILKQFNQNNKDYMAVSPMSPIYGMFKQRYMQRERDRIY